jgi:hypothetical protein
MASLLSRLPSRQETWLAFTMAAFMVHSWALLNYLREVPGYLLRMPISGMWGVLAYVLSNTLFESLLITGLVALVCMLTPRRFLKDRFVPQAAVLILAPCLWIIPLHYQARIVGVLDAGPLGNLGLLAVWLLTFLVALIDLSIVFRRYPRVEAGLISFADRLTVLAGVYVFVDILGVITVLLRNLL